MRKMISEDDIEQAILQRLSAVPLQYDIIRCSADPSKREDLNDGTGRTGKRECVLPDVLWQSLKRLNPNIDEEYLKPIFKELRRDYTGTDLVATNYKLYNQIRNGIKITVRKNGKEDFDFVRLMDFDNPTNNTFTAVSQMWVQGKAYFHRPDIMVFVNGLPVVFIELKNSIIKVEEAYNKNLKSYIADVPNLFAFNQICVLSNGLETKLGAFNATYEYFFEWLRVESEKEKLNRSAMLAAECISDSSVKYFVDGLLNKTRLIDYIENFILFQNQSTKIIAKNHQYLGVNNLMESVNNRKALQGKLGVFWHTQGSGKSFSMVMFTRKVKRKIPGNFTFLIVTDREDLDTQIHKNFVRTEVIGNKEECQPKNGRQLREFLQTNKAFIFTLIHKFNYDKKKEDKYPLLSERDDIIVLVDEAHRTQYKDLAENMRTALPNANYVAFTGTPLLGSKRLTNQWFGNYVSEYNFAQSVEDGSTVPLYYSRRVPEVGITNDGFDEDLTRILEDENLNDAERQKLENQFARVLEVIKRDSRLDKIARDIAYHFPRRGFLGKGMVVSVDKYTAVKMYDKVQHYWNDEKQNIIKERNSATDERKAELSKILDYMNRVQMAVIISEEADENEKFAKQGLNIAIHRAKMTDVADGKDIEDHFKDPDDPLQLVFVCAMWLTGFDVPNLSTLYLDKPMKGHTLMQAIARANRVYPNKTCGLIVDYVNVFQNMKKALTEYATGDDGIEYPAKDMDKLVGYIDGTIAEADAYLLSLGINLDEIMSIKDVLEQLEAFREAYNTIVARDDDKEKMKVLLNTLSNLYEASKPEIFERNWYNAKFKPLDYLHGLFYHTINDEKVNRARQRVGELMDMSITVTQDKQEQSTTGALATTKVIDLSKIDVEALRKEIRVAKYKAIEIDDLKQYLEELLQQMLNRNCTRTAFSERFKHIIDTYNAGGTENEEYYEQLLKFVEELKREGQRADAEGLTEEQLEIYDLLIAGKKLTKAEEQKVKLSAKNLYQTLTENRSTLLVVDWYKDEQPRAKVQSAIETSLDHDLPDSYDVDSFRSKIDLLMNHFIDMAVQGYGWIGTAA